MLGSPWTPVLAWLRARRLPVALAGAVAAGLCLLVAFPPYGWWPAAVLGVALLTLSVRGLRLRTGLLLGTVAGLALFVPLLAWTGLHTGLLPWLLLSLAMAVQIGLLVGLPTAVSAVLFDRRPWLTGPVVGAVWTLQEAVRDRAPFGGFPWGRLAFSQADGPLVMLASLGGAPLVTFGVGCLGGLVAGLVVRLSDWTPSPDWMRSLRRSEWSWADWTWAELGGRLWPVLRSVGVELAVFGAVVFGCSLAPLTRPAATERPLTIAIVQGNVPRLGLEFNEQRRAVLDNHVRGTLDLAERVRSGRVAQPDLVVWPENSSDIDPLRNLDAAQEIDRAAAAIGAPIVVGALINTGDEVFNMSLVWQSGVGITSGYVKRHPVPFAEYIPLRSVARMVSREVDRVATDFSAGRGTGGVKVGSALLSPVICFEVAYDGLVRDSVADGGQALLVQTNNATFDRAEAAQQLAMVRLRAIEHGRPALMASTVGISAFVRADGSVSVSSGFDVPATLVDVVRVPRASTLATRLGSWPELGLVAGAVVAIGFAVVLRCRARRMRRASRGTDGDGCADCGDCDRCGGAGRVDHGCPAAGHAVDVAAGAGDGPGGQLAVSP